jgi:hypothetical protein
MELTGTTCRNGHTFEGVRTTHEPCPVCGAQERIFRVEGAAMARAIAPPPSLVIESWADVYERHRGWLVPALLVSFCAAVVTKLLLNGWIALLVTACALVLGWTFRRREFTPKRVRTIERR